MLTCELTLSHIQINTLVSCHLSDIHIQYEYSESPYQANFVFGGIVF